MINSTAAREVLRLMEEITLTGPVLPEFDGLRAFDHPDRLLSQLTGATVDVPPVTIDLWPSLTCNARCPLCQYRVSGARDEVDRSGHLELMAPRLAESIFDGAALTGVRSIILTGGGEPLLNPHLVELARLARVHGLCWSLNTNAFLLDSVVAKALLDEKPSYLKISVDAGTPETHKAIYQTPADWFHKVVDNAIVAARLSLTAGNRNIGISFSLASNTSDEELGRIRDTVEHILLESAGALGFVVFRARLLHYRGLAPVVPQPSHVRFPYLADSIEDRVITPLASTWGQTTKFDLKKGLFLLAARESVPTKCFSNSWMTTITQVAEGYATGELAGAAASGQCWGRIEKPADFRSLWFGPKRRELHESIESGKIPLPVVHRTSPVDEFFRRLHRIIGPRVEEAEAIEIIHAVSSASWYRSRNSNFV